MKRTNLNEAHKFTHMLGNRVGDQGSRPVAVEETRIETGIGFNREKQ